MKKQQEIIKTNIDQTTRAGKALVLQLITGNSIKTSELADKTFNAVEYLFYKDIAYDENGEMTETKEILVLVDDQGNQTGTISSTFIEKMLLFIETMGMSKEEPLPIIPRFGVMKSKAGRDFLDVDLVV